MHKALINGTEYDVTGGKALIGGTSYTISKGRTLVGGTGYDISFGTWRDRFIRLMGNATLVVRAGRNSSSSSYVRVSTSSLTAGTYYAFALAGGDVGIIKVVNDGVNWTITPLYYRQAGANKYWTLYKSGSYLYISSSGTSYNDIYGGGLFVFSFSGYNEANIDSILSGFTVQNVTYRNTDTRDIMRVADTTTNALLVQFYGDIGLSYPYGTVILGSNTANPSLLIHSGNYYGISTDGSSMDRAYGANIIEL